MGAAAKRLKLVQVPGASLANAYGHEVGVAEYVVGAMLG